MTQYLDWVRNTRQATVSAPPSSCDCAVHIYRPKGVGTLSPQRRYDPPQASIEELEAVHAAMGIERAVIVQASIYGNDHTVMLEALRRAPERYRGIAVIDEGTSDAQLRELHEAGVRGARFNLLARFGTAFDPKAFLRSVERVQAMGWSASLHATVPELKEKRAVIDQIRGTVILDHVAYFFDPADGNQPQDLDFLRSFTDRGHWWIKISRMDRYVRAPYDAVVGTLGRLVQAAPDRTVWATDWPHVLYPADAAVVPNDADLIELVFRCVPDAALREKLLVHNPARLFDFPAAG
ncbi:MAG: amidohydrolase family protein [Hydrogenophaga sp.]|nr:amidohydrolase family protein [Hydrogenophaga sp.]